jgi:hypothetical protein
MLKPQEESLQWLSRLGLPWVAVDPAGEVFSDELLGRGHG